MNKWKSKGKNSLPKGHFSARYKDLNVLLEEAQSLFPNTDLAEESTVYKIEEVIPRVR